MGTTTSGAVAVNYGDRDIDIGIRNGGIQSTAVSGVKTDAGSTIISGVASTNPILSVGSTLAYTRVVFCKHRNAIVSGVKVAGSWVESWFG